MKTYFACSDIHGYFKEWMVSLNKAGFDANNNEHILIILGDIFDRGKKPWQIYKFITSLPKERVILIKGNHEYLLIELVRRKHPFSFDYHNGTYDTLVYLRKEDPYETRRKWINKYKDKYKEVDYFTLFSRADEIYRDANEKLYNNNKLNEILDWLNSSDWKNYYELGQYIFVHSFIPLLGVDDIYKIDSPGTYYPDWRNEKNPALWLMATWGCPYKRYLEGSFKEEERKGKVLVCGHWHTSDFYNKLIPGSNMDIKKENPIFKSEQYPGLIGLDACTALTHKVNVLIIKEDELLV